MWQTVKESDHHIIESYEVSLKVCEYDASLILLHKPQKLVMSPGYWNIPSLYRSISGCCTNRTWTGIKYWIVCDVLWGRTKDHLLYEWYVHCKTFPLSEHSFNLQCDVFVQVVHIWEYSTIACRTKSFTTTPCTDWYKDKWKRYVVTWHHRMAGRARCVLGNPASLEILGVLVNLCLQVCLSVCLSAYLCLSISCHLK